MFRLCHLSIVPDISQLHANSRTVRQCELLSNAQRCNDQVTAGRLLRDPLGDLQIDASLTKSEVGEHSTSTAADCPCRNVPLMRKERFMRLGRRLKPTDLSLWNL